MTTTHRRGFLGRCIAATVGLIAGGGIAVAAPIRDWQTSKDVMLYRESVRFGDVRNYEGVDWFDQRPGDIITAIWRDAATGKAGRAERWKVVSQFHGEPCRPVYRDDRGVEVVCLDWSQDVPLADVWWASDFPA